MLELGRLLGRISLKTSEPLTYLHTSKRCGWTGALLTHMRTSPKGSVEACWNTIMLSHLLGGSDMFLQVDDGEESHRVQGRIRIQPPYEVVRGTWESSSETVNLFLDPRHCEAVLGRPLAAGKIQFHARRTRNDHILETLMEALLIDSASNGSRGPALGNSIVAAIIHRLDEAQDFSPATYSSASPGEPYVKQAMDFIEVNLSSKIVVDELASLSGLSTRHFCRTFKSATGISPYQYITARRLEKARRLISQGTLSLQEIAVETGFARHGNLSTAFQASFGMTPSQFRNILG